MNVLKNNNYHGEVATMDEVELDEKFNHILAKLDTRKETGSNNNYHG